MQHPLQLDANYADYISNESALIDSIVDEVAKWGGLENFTDENFIGNYSRIPKDNITLTEGKRTKAANNKVRNGSPAIVKTSTQAYANTRSHNLSHFNVLCLCCGFHMLFQ